MTGLAPRRVAPFGHLGITACVPLPRAYRSLPRPSSPLCAQASPTCHLSLDLPYRSSRACANMHTAITASRTDTLPCPVKRWDSLPTISTLFPLSNIVRRVTKQLLVSLNVPADYPGESGEPNGPMQIVKGAESEFCRRSAISSFPPRTRYQSRAQRQPRAWSTRDASGAASPRYLCSLMIFPARGQGTASTRRPRALKPPCGPKNAADCRLLPQPKSTVETLRSARLA